MLVSTNHSSTPTRQPPNLLNECFAKVNKVHTRLVLTYTNLLCGRAHKLIGAYFLVSLLLSIGLIQIQFTMSTDNLAIIRNSPSQRDVKILKETFGSNQHEAHYNNKLYDLGYNFDIMLTVKMPNESSRQLDESFLAPQFNMINRTILDEYNQLFDEIMAIEIQETIAIDKANQSIKKYTFRDGLCARRLSKCSIEGGVLRAEKLQSQLLHHGISIMENDIKQTYFDSEQMDVLNFPFAFGEYKKFKKMHGQLFLTHASAIRNRFDLLAETETERRLSIKYMEAFVEYMTGVVTSEPSRFPSLEINYFTSHSLTPEIEKYSTIEIKYVGLSFLVFWILLFVLFISSTTTRRSSDDLYGQDSFISSIRMYLGVVLLVLAIFLQIVVTFMSAFGLLALFKVNPNFLTTTIVFIVTIITGNQAYLIFAKINRQSDQLSRKLERQLSEGSIHQSALNSIILRVTAQQCLIPICYSSITAILTYSTIGAVDGFDSTRIYCIFTIFCLMSNLFGQLTFYFPICSIYLNQTNSKKVNVSACADPNDIIKPVNNSTESNSPSSDQSVPKSRQFSVVNLLFKSPVKFAVLFLFLAYLSFNAFICIRYLDVNIPIIELIPKQSFLRNFMVYHQTLFKLGPVVTIAILKPLNYSDMSTVKKMGHLLDTEMSFSSINDKLQVNWLEDLYTNIKDQGQFYERCRAPIQHKCFQDTLQQTVVNFDFYQDDVVASPTQNGSTDIVVSKARFYLFMKEFTGSIQESEHMHEMRRVADENAKQLNISVNDIIVYSPVYIYLEQLEDIIASFLSMFMLNLEYIFVVGFFLVFNLTSLLVLLVINISLLLSILSTFALFGFSLNIVTLNHFLILPAFMCEFFTYTAYSLRSDPPSDKSLISSNSTEMKSLVKDLKLDSESTTTTTTAASTKSAEEVLDVICQLTTKKSKLEGIFHSNLICSFNYLICVLGLSFSLMYICSTYNFETLFIFLMSFSFNAYLHLVLFYPVLSLLLGTCQ